MDQNVSRETPISAWNFEDAEQSGKKPNLPIKNNAAQFSFGMASKKKDAEKLSSQINVEGKGILFLQLTFFLPFVLLDKAVEPMDLSIDKNVSGQIQDALMDVSLDRNVSGETSSSAWNFVNTGQIGKEPILPMMHTKQYADQFSFIMANIHENAKKLTSQVNAEGKGTLFLQLNFFLPFVLPGKVGEPMDLTMNRNETASKRFVDKAFPMVTIPNAIVKASMKRPRDDETSGNTEGNRKKMKFTSPILQLDRK